MGLLLNVSVVELILVSTRKTKTALRKARRGKPIFFIRPGSNMLGPWVVERPKMDTVDFIIAFNLTKRPKTDE